MCNCSSDWDLLVINVAKQVEHEILMFKSGEDTVGQTRVVLVYSFKERFKIHFDNESCSTDLAHLGY